MEGGSGSSDLNMISALPVTRLRGDLLDCVFFGREDQFSLATTEAFFPQERNSVCLQGSTVMDDSVDLKFRTSTNARLKSKKSQYLLRVEVANTLGHQCNRVSFHLGHCCLGWLLI